MSRLRRLASDLLPLLKRAETALVPGMRVANPLFNVYSYSLASSLTRDYWIPNLLAIFLQVVLDCFHGSFVTFITAI